MSDIERLVASFVQFLGTQLRCDHLSADTKESLEVAIQCLESAYSISSSDVRLLPKKSLIEIFREGTKDDPFVKESEEEVTEEMKQEAERLKIEGNNLMKQEKYEEALKNYTEAIKLDSKNAVFYCNRAAAYSKLNQHTFSIEDCNKAIKIDPNYSKAYGRMGLAFSNLNDHYQARDYYKKAVELDPSNESYANNLKVAEEKIAELANQNPMASFGSMFTNPQMMVDMAHQLLQDTNMRNILSNAFSSLVNPNQEGSQASSQAPPPNREATQERAQEPHEPHEPQAPETSGQASGSSMPNYPSNLDTFLRVGQQIAAQVEASNPQFFNQLRRRFENPNSDNNNSDNGDNA